MQSDVFPQQLLPLFGWRILNLCMSALRDDLYTSRLASAFLPRIETIVKDSYRLGLPFDLGSRR